MQPNDQQMIQQTRHWVQNFIIPLHICPFAKQVVDKDRLRIQVSTSQTLEQALTTLGDEIALLETNPEIETSLLLFPRQFSDFYDYLDFVDLAEGLLKQSGFEGIYQLASFHPDYCFADVNADDVSNYTNRSPYPMLHLLRETSVEKAIAFYGDTHLIPERNIAKMHELGLKGIASILQKTSNEWPIEDNLS